MDKISIILLIGLTALFPNCKSTKLPPGEYKSDQIIFGNGGGFTGAYHEYILLDDGRMFTSGKNVTNPSETKTINKKLTEQIFENINTFGLDKLQYNNPQNMYEFVKIIHEGDTNHIVWSGKPDSQLAAVNSIYRLLITQIKSKKDDSDN